jgi:hypothetical protein
VEEEIFLSSLVFCLFFNLLSKCFLFHTQKRSRRGKSQGANAFGLQSAVGSSNCELPTFVF